MLMCVTYVQEVVGIDTKLKHTYHYYITKLFYKTMQRQVVFVVH